MSVTDTLLVMPMPLFHRILATAERCIALVKPVLRSLTMQVSIGFTAALLFSACGGVKPEPAPATEAHPTMEAPKLVLSGHLICTATHCFFAPDAAGKAALAEPGDDQAQENTYIMVSAPEPEPYFAFRSTYLPPMRSFMRVECADTQYEVSAAWDEVCPVRAVMHSDDEGNTTFSDYAPADTEFLKTFADEYNREALAGIYRGMAGTPTTEEMRGKALPSDGEFYYPSESYIGPHTKRYLAEGEEALKRAYTAAEEVNRRERNDLRLIFDYDEIPDPTGGHTEEWASVDASGNVVSIHGTPYQLSFTQTGADKAWQLFFVDTDSATRLELDVRVGAQKLPFSIAVRDKLDPCSAVTRLFLAPDGKSLVVDAFCGADHEKSGPLCVSWREGAPVMETPVRTLEWLTRAPATKTDEFFVGWNGTRPVTTHRRRYAD